MEGAPVDRPASVALARGARRLLVKAGAGIVRLEVGPTPLAEADAVMLLVHEDGFLRVPVLLLDDLLVRGFTTELYTEALAGVAGR